MCARTIKVECNSGMKNHDKGIETSHAGQLDFGHTLVTCCSISCFATSAYLLCHTAFPPLSPHCPFPLSGTSTKYKRLTPSPHPPSLSHPPLHIPPPPQPVRLHRRNTGLLPTVLSARYHHPAPPRDSPLEDSRALCPVLAVACGFGGGEVKRERRNMPGMSDPALRPNVR